MEQAREHAAQVALLRVRPHRMTWPEITTEVVEVGSAVEVWERYVPVTLLGGLEEAHRSCGRTDDWAKALVGRPGVHAATGWDEVMAVVRRITTERAALQAQLRHLLSA